MKDLLILLVFKSAKESSAPMKGYVGFYRLLTSTVQILFEINHDEKMVYMRAVDSRGGIYKYFILLLKLTLINLLIHW